MFDSAVIDDNKYARVAECASESPDTHLYLQLSIAIFKEKLLRSKHSLLKDDLYKILGYISKLNIDIRELLKKLEIVIKTYTQEFLNHTSEANHYQSLSGNDFDEQEILRMFLLEIQAWKRLWITESRGIEDENEIWFEIPGNEKAIARAAATRYTIPEMNVRPDFGNENGIPQMPVYTNGHEKLNGVVYGEEETYESLQRIKKAKLLQKALLIRCREFCLYLSQSKLPSSLASFSYDFGGIINPPGGIELSDSIAFIEHIKRFLKSKSTQIALDSTHRNAIERFVSELDLFIGRFDEISPRVIES